MENTEILSTEPVSEGTLPARSALVNRQIALENELQRVTNALAVLDGLKPKGKRGRRRKPITDAPAAPALTVDEALANAKRLKGDRIDLRTKEGKFLFQSRIVDSKGNVITADAPATDAVEPVATEEVATV